MFYLSDLSIVIDLVRNGLDVFHKDENFIWTIKQFLLRDWIVNLQHTSLESVVTIDFLTTKDVLSDNDFVVFYKALNMSSILLANVMNVEFVRLGTMLFKHYSLSKCHEH